MHGSVAKELVFIVKLCVMVYLFEMLTVISFLLGVLLVWGLLYAAWHFGLRRLTVLTRGQVYRSAAMDPRKLRRMIRRLGLKTVYDLRTRSEGDVDTERAAVEAEGCAYLNLSSAQVPSDEGRRAFLDHIGDAANRPALIHCTHGEGRAVLFGALWLIEHEKIPPPLARKKCRWITTRGSTFDLDREKGIFLENYRPERWG